MTNRRLDAPREAGPGSVQALPPEFQRIVQLLCDTYEAMDLRIETTLGSAENDFLSALPELKGHEEELRCLVALLINDLSSAVVGTEAQSLLLQLAFQDEGDLAERILSGIETQGAA